MMRSISTGRGSLNFVAGESAAGRPGGGGAVSFASAGRGGRWSMGGFMHPATSTTARKIHLAFIGLRGLFVTGDCGIEQHHRFVERVQRSRLLGAARCKLDAQFSSVTNLRADGCVSLRLVAVRSVMHESVF